MHGQFVWYELMTPNVDAARKFYAPLANWGTQPFDKSYTLWTTGGAPFAGLQPLGPKEREQGIPPHWMPYLETSNIADTVRLASSLGAKMMVPPTDIPNVGTFAVIQDPQGAVFGVLDTKGRPGGWNGTPVVGRFSWHELMAMDHNKAFEFYKRLFGWEKTGEMDMGGGNTYLMYGKGKPFGGIFTRPPEMASMRPFWLSYIHVKDVQKAVDTATKAGAFVQRPPMPIPGGMIAILGDPQGAAFAVVDASAPSTATQSTTRPARKSASKPRAKTGAKKKAASKTKATKKRRPAGKKRTPAKKTARRAPAAKRRGTKRRVRRSR
jgi:predicted enzyme related to lactoylglutathione lyase